VHPAEDERGHHTVWDRARRLPRAWHGYPDPARGRDEQAAHVNHEKHAEMEANAAEIEGADGTGATTEEEVAQNNNADTDAAVAAMAAGAGVGAGTGGATGAAAAAAAAAVP